MTHYDIESKLEQLQEDVLEDATPHSAADLGLDSRCGEVYVGYDFVATYDARAIEYYGGFEYIEAEYKMCIGDLAIYSGDASRVAEALEHAEAELA